MKQVFLSTTMAVMLTVQGFSQYPSVESPLQISSCYLKDPMEVAKVCLQSIKEFDEELGQFLLIPVDEKSSSEILNQWDLINAKLASKANLFNALGLVEPNQPLRKAYLEGYQELRKKIIETFSEKKEIYNFFHALEEKEKKRATLNKEETYCLDELLKEMRHDGLHLEGKKRESLKQVKVELSQISNQFAINIQEDKSGIFVKKEELSGLSEAFLQDCKVTEEGLYRIGCDYPTYFYVMKSAENEKVRQALYRAFMNRAYPQNKEVLAQMIAKRDEMAKLLGQSSFAYYQLSREMVKTPDHAVVFLDSLVSKSQQKQHKELALLTSMSPELSLTKEGKLNPWDVAYAQEKLMKRKYQIDEELIKEYFPLENTLASLIDIYEKFFDLKMRTINVDGLWHTDVKVMEIVCKEKQKVLGYILLDLFPRENKYSHACHATIISGIERGEINTTSLSLVVANFPKPSVDKPALMSLSDARTFFHEFGHAIHSVLGRTRFVMTSGTSVKVDFVELPSQMLEEWLWDPAMIKMISSHYKTKEKLSDEMIDNLLKTRNISSGAFIGRQCLLSDFSLQCFMPGASKDLDQIMKNLHERVKVYYNYDEHSHFQASFGHLDEYGARYYGYLWSRVFALDVFEVIKKEGLLNPEVGKRYAKEILSKGGSEDPSQLLRNFLGREPSQAPFLKVYGITD